MNKCAHCGEQMPKTSGRGRAKKYCSATCQDLAGMLRPKAALKLCSVDGCGAHANRIGAGLCEAHYMRVRRKGTTLTEFERAAQTVAHSQGYRLVKAKGHPRSLGLGRAYEHRVVYTDAHGEGPFKCHWCAIEVTWETMHVDHLNEDKTDNRVDNLVASCALCNMHRSDAKKMAAIREKYGIEHAGEKLTLNEWAARLGISRVSIVWRLKQGWPVERALTEGRGKTGPKSLRDLLE